MTPEELLRLGKLDECLKACEDQVRRDPSDPRQRVLLFQVLCVLGEWDRALNQLEVASELDQQNTLLAQMYRATILCEKLREEVFQGKRTPLVVGEPEEWVGLMIQANALTGEGRLSAGEELRAKAFELAPAASGTIKVGREEDSAKEHAFEWIADADPRLGPLIELVVGGKYYWAPFSRISLLRIEKPTDLRDTVWLPGQVVWSTGGEQVVLVPVRYPGSQDRGNDVQIRLARRTEWLDKPFERPIGQRLIATDAGEYNLLDTREIRVSQTGA